VIERPAQRIVEDDQNELVARRLVLELDDIVGDQRDRWVLPHVLARRLQLHAMVIRGALKQGQARGWFEVEAGSKRVRLLDLGRGLIGGAQHHHRRTQPAEPSPHRRPGRARRLRSHPLRRHW
jgi:hypothetical protein